MDRKNKLFFIIQEGTLPCLKDFLQNKANGFDSESLHCLKIMAGISDLEQLEVDFISFIASMISELVILRGGIFMFDNVSFIV